MASTIVISQAMYFPWLGLFEQILLSDMFVIYDDVDFSKGSFVNRVQIKTSSGVKWLTVPLSKVKLKTPINETLILNDTDWKNSQFDFLKTTYKNHPFKEDVFNLLEILFSMDINNISDLSQKSIELVLNYFNIKRNILKSSQLNIDGSSSQRVCDIVKELQGTIYVTGHGAKNYLDHMLFEKHGIEVKYMSYNLHAYPQMDGAFTPYVSILDLIANQGQNGLQYMNSQAIYWKEFLKDNYE